MLKFENGSVIVLPVDDHCAVFHAEKGVLSLIGVSLDPRSVSEILNDIREVAAEKIHGVEKTERKAKLKMAVIAHEMHSPDPEIRAKAEKAMAANSAIFQETQEKSHAVLAQSNKLLADTAALMVEFGVEMNELPDFDRAEADFQKEVGSLINELFSGLFKSENNE